MIDISWNNRKTLVTNSFLCDYATTGRSSAHPSHSDSCWRCIGRETEKEARSERGGGGRKGNQRRMYQKGMKNGGEGRGGGKKEARRVIARDCTVARIIARAPEKRHFKFVHPPEKRTFSSLLRAPVPIGSTEYPRYPSFERRFFETPAMLSPRPSYNISPCP